MKFPGRIIVLSCAALSAGHAQIAPKGTLAQQSIPALSVRLSGPAADRVNANIENWLLPAPLANPGMIEMFHRRDRTPEPQLVPWAGEFAGKYLLSGIAALQMSDDSRLEPVVRSVVNQLIDSQADDGYLGPFPKAMRLRGNWDLWGHYHCMQALLRWHDRTGDPRALQSVRRAADLMARTFLDGKLRVIDAGSPEMNMAVIHVLGELHRRTGEPRYLQLVREIEKDWEKGGDYFRTGLAGIPFFLTPRPRWESLHDLQGLVELYRMTGDDRYRTAFANLWKSIVRWDRHNTGGFSSGEQAVGDSFSPLPIETCCTVAWMAISCDMLRLTADPRVADELELSFYNGALGAQHPSGRWWTYNTPMDGVKEASAHSIVFQARAGTPELNCCSVNGPRSLGMTAEWGLMEDPEGLVLNYLGAATWKTVLNGKRVEIKTISNYPRDGEVEIEVRPQRSFEFFLKVRIPSWADHPALDINRAPNPVFAGSYALLKRKWKSGDRIRLHLGMAPRALPGDREAAGKVSLYRGPVLLAFDPRFNRLDEKDLPSLKSGEWNRAELVAESRDVTFEKVRIPTEKGEVILCDFASAGATGTRYRTWLDAQMPPPPIPIPRIPNDGARISGRGGWFKWTGPARTNAAVSAYRLEIAALPDFSTLSWKSGPLHENRVYLDPSVLGNLHFGGPWTWRVVAANGSGESVSPGPAPAFSVDFNLPAESRSGSLPSNGIVIAARLDGSLDAQTGKGASGTARFVESRKPGRTSAALNGADQKITFSFDEFPEEDYAASVWFFVDELPAGHLGQVVSAWAKGVDDPLRICIADGKLYARLEAGQSASTEGIPIEAGRWHHVAAVKSGSELRLFLDGKRKKSCPAPAYLSTSAKEISLGGNPRFPGNEYLKARFSDFQFFARSLSDDEVRNLFERTDSEQPGRRSH